MSCLPFIMHTRSHNGSLLIKGEMCGCGLPISIVISACSSIATRLITKVSKSVLPCMKFETVFKLSLTKPVEYILPICAL